MKYVETYIKEIQSTIDTLPIEIVEEAIDALHEARMKGRQIFIMGNGGSASTASHFVCDLSKNTRKDGWPNFKVIGLTDNNAIFSAYANDEGYENVFAQQLASLIQPGDTVIAISASGNSQNVVKAVDLAKRVHAYTIGFTGFDGGIIGKMVDLNIHIPSNIIEHVEDVHLMLEHMMTKSLREMIQSMPFKIHHSSRIQETTESIELTTDYSSGKPVVTMDMTATRKNRYVFELVQEIMHELDGLADTHELLNRLLPLTMKGIGATSGSIVMLNELGEVLEGALAYDGTIQIHPATKFKDIVHNGLVGWVIQNRTSALIENTLKDPRWLSRSWEDSEDAARSAISVPLTDNDQVVGVVTLVNSHSKPFTMEDMAVLTAIAVTVSVNKARAFVNNR